LDCQIRNTFHLPLPENRINEGWWKDLGNNELINSEMVIAINPEVVVGLALTIIIKAYGSHSTPYTSSLLYGDGRKRLLWAKPNG